MQSVTDIIDGAVGMIQSIFMVLWFAMLAVLWTVILAPLKFFGCEFLVNVDWDIIWKPGGYVVGAILAMVAAFFAVVFILLGIFYVIKYVCIALWLVVKYTALGIWWTVKNISIQLYEVFIKIIKLLVEALHCLMLWIYDKICSVFTR